MQLYDYKFVRLEQENTWFSGKMPSESTLGGYGEIVQQHANEGWRLVQIFAPSIGTAGQPTYFELILERPRHDLS